MYISGAVAHAHLLARRPLRAAIFNGNAGTGAFSVSRAGWTTNLARAHTLLHTYIHTHPPTHTHVLRSPAFTTRRRMSRRLRRRRSVKRRHNERARAARPLLKTCIRYVMSMQTRVHTHMQDEERQRGAMGGMARGKRGIGAGSERASQRLSKCLLLALPR
jgi:hypothetical protein